MSVNDRAMNHLSLRNSNQTQEESRLYGKYPGRVLENKAPDNGNHRGVLLVEISGLLEEKPDGSGEQLMQVSALPCFMPGFFFVPEKEARVWVEFVAGDINTPIWTGVWYPEKKAPATFDDQATTEFQKIIRTASGHVIQIDDTQDKEQVIVRHKADTIISMDKDNLNAKHHSGTSINVDKDGNLVIKHKDGMKIEVGESKIQAKADNIILDGSVEITGDLVVGKGPKTTISGNIIEGSDG